MAANLSPPILPFSRSNTHQFGLFTASPASSRTNVSRPSRAPRVSMALSPLEKHNLLSFSFFPTDVLIRTKPPQNPSSSSPTPSALNFDTDDDTASDLKTGEPASDLPSSMDVDSPAPHNLSSPPSPSSDFNLGSDMGDFCNLKPVNPGSDPLQSEMRTPQYPQPPSV